MRSVRTQLDAHGKHQLVIKRGGLHGPQRGCRPSPLRDLNLYRNFTKLSARTLWCIRKGAHDDTREAK